MFFFFKTKYCSELVSSQIKATGVWTRNNDKCEFTCINGFLQVNLDIILQVFSHCKVLSFKNYSENYTGLNVP